MSMRQLKITNSITVRESQSLDRYLQEIGKIQLLTPDEEVSLAQQIRKGNKKALDQLTRANLRFVVSVAKQYQGQGLSLSDLINEGNIGLILAAKRFDPTRGFKFISFAVWWIRQNVLMAISNSARTIRIPINKLAVSGQIKRMTDSLEQQLGRTPSNEELAETLNMDVDELTDNLRTSQTLVSLDRSINEDDQSCLLDVIENPNAEKTDNLLSHHESLKTEVSRLLTLIPERNREILSEYFGIGVEQSLTIEELARKYALSVERIRQIRDKGLSKLRAQSNVNVLRTYLAA